MMRTRRWIGRLCWIALFPIAVVAAVITGRITARRIARRLKDERRAGEMWRKDTGADWDAPPVLLGPGGDYRRPWPDRWKDTRFTGEYEAIQRVLGLGHRWGFGNLIQSLRDEWARTLADERRVSKERAAALIDKSGSEGTPAAG